VIELFAWTHDQIVAALVENGNPAPQANEIVPNVAFSLLATASDYSRFLTALLEPQNSVLGMSAATRQTMQTTVSKVNSTLSWGLGVGIEKLLGRNIYGSREDNGGWKDFLLAQPASQSAIVVFTNGNNCVHVNERVLQGRYWH